MTETAAEASEGLDRDWSKPVLTTTTVAELGARMPLGLKSGDGKLHQQLAARSWRLKEERALGHRREELQGENMGRYVSVVLSTMLTRFGDRDWSEWRDKDTTERELVISQLWMPDVFYAYVWLRIQAMGNSLPMGLKCPRCQAKLADFDWIGDLSTLEVRVPASVEDALWQYILQDPLTIRTKQVTKMVMAPPRWHHIEAIGDTTVGAAKASVIHASIHQLPEVQEGEIALDESELDEMSKRDVEALADKINDNGYGPRMTLEPICPRGHRFDVPIDWRYDSFFGISSPSQD